MVKSSFRWLKRWIFFIVHKKNENYKFFPIYKEMLAFLFSKHKLFSFLTFCFNKKIEFI